MLFNFEVTFCLPSKYTLSSIVFQMISKNNFLESSSNTIVGKVQKLKPTINFKTTQQHFMRWAH